MSNHRDDRNENTWNVLENQDIHDDPLLDCLIVLSRIYGRNVSKASLIAGLPLVQNRLTVKLFNRAANRADLSSRTLAKPLNDISPIHLPAILLLQNREACILVEKNSSLNRLKIIIPQSGSGEQEISFNELEKIYTGYGIFIRPKYQTDQKSVADEKADKSKHWFWGTIMESWRVYRDVLLAAFLINVFGLVGIFYVLNVYDRVIPNNATETLWVLSIGVLVIYLFAVVMRALRSYFVDEAAKKANLKISAMLLQKVLNLKMESRPQSIGSFTKNLQEFESIRDFITSFSITAVIDLPFTFLGLLVVWWIGGYIVLIHVIIIVLLIIYAYFVQAPLRQVVEKTLKASAQKNAILVEGVAGLETIKMLGAEGQIQRAWEEAVSYISKWGNKSRMISSSVQDVSYFLQNFMTVAVVVAGVYMITAGSLTSGGLVALVILSRQVIAPMAQVVNLATRYHHVREALKTLDDIMNLPVERPAGKTFLPRKRFDGVIGIKNLTFSYPGQTTKVLNNISLEIAAGEKVGIIGPVGSGKTTLGKLMLGLYEPVSGMVTMDGTDIRQIDPAELRHFLGYVPQDITLFQGTLRDNITMGVNNVDDQNVLHAAEMAGIIEFAKIHPSGFDMKVEEFGRGLSGGQRQSVVMARALLLDPPVLVLDEPTSNMDNRSEIRLKRYLTQAVKEKTMVIITHRASLLDMVTRLIVIDHGSIVADGPKDFVLEAMRKGQLNL
ncbi:MAG: type I secretion system permease/ATPase [Deltaproteobacteria bacterium]|jgi:ATP-binding cassette subfamily C protein LapB|nr:type I secretion system permease/ATPase [Smithella sp.]NMC98020.1 type I secretion system permease/ATPase [Deltaproteobacteria bacterium]HOO34688.1 type I secretion system permease/ATPase [Smithella sp.]HPR14383.1 type I secretion system permease/ATPase [Smithella sp.]HPV51903.1 type I secretion system permease/ATPase [Smithella sp.]